MMANQRSNLPDYLQGLNGVLRLDEPMTRHTTWRAGGKAASSYTPAGKQDLLHLLARLPTQMPVFWVGLGSNLLVRDGGLSGMVICTRGSLDRIEVHPDRQLYVEPGVNSARIARTARDHGLSGVEFLSGVPGTLGGALAMNAGAYGGQTWDWVRSAELVNRGGELITVTPDQLKIGYRHVEIPENHWFVSALFQLDQASSSDGYDKLSSLLEKRSTSQPLNTANAGSVFKNPAGDHAARLLEAVGMKGQRCGGAVVSGLHANFIINQDNASAADIESLIAEGRERVAAQFAVQLETEVKIIGVSG